MAADEGGFARTTKSGRRKTKRRRIIERYGNHLSSKVMIFKLFRNFDYYLLLLNRITPSWVTFTDGERLIGEAAKNQAAANAERTIFDVKRLIRKKFDDKEVHKDMILVPYKIVNKDGKPYIQVKIKDGETKVFSPEEISAMILTKMKGTVEVFLGKTIKDVVVTVPGNQECWCNCWFECCKDYQ